MPFGTNDEVIKSFGQNDEVVNPSSLSQKDKEDLDRSKLWEDVKKYGANVRDTALGAVETSLNVIGGGGGMFVAPIGGLMHAISEETQGRQGDFGESYATLMHNAGSLGFLH